MLTKLETDMEWIYEILRLDSDILRCRPMQIFETLRPRQHRRYFDNDICKCFILNENIWILIQISMKFVPSGQTNNIPDNSLAPTRLQAIIWTNDGYLIMYICVTWPQWVRVISRCLSRCTLTSIIEGTTRFVDIHLRYMGCFLWKDCMIYGVWFHIVSQMNSPSI